MSKCTQLAQLDQIRCKLMAMPPAVTTVETPVKLAKSGKPKAFTNTFALDAHPEKSNIISDLLRGNSYQAVAKRYGGLSYVALWRWWQRNGKRYQAGDNPHKVEAKRKALQIQATQQDVIAEEAEKLRAEGWGLVKTAKEEGDLKALALGIRETRESLRFEAELSGRLGGSGTTINVNIGVIQPRPGDEPTVQVAPLALPAAPDPNIIDAEAIEPGE